MRNQTKDVLAAVAEYSNLEHTRHCRPLVTENQYFSLLQHWVDSISARAGEKKKATKNETWLGGEVEWKDSVFFRDVECERKSERRRVLEWGQNWKRIFIVPIFFLRWIYVHTSPIYTLQMKTERQKKGWTSVRREKRMTKEENSKWVRTYMWGGLR